MFVMYGIKNCDTIKKARKWLEENKVAYEFFDYKKEGVSAELADGFVKELGWEALINKRGTTWRNLPEDTKNNIDETVAKQLMMENPDRKSTRLNSSHVRISYAVFCLKKKK